MFVKIMKKAKKNYYYWAINERVNGKIKIKLYRALTFMEKVNLQEKEIVAVAAFGWSHLPGDKEYGVLMIDVLFFLWKIC